MAPAASHPKDLHLHRFTHERWTEMRPSATSKCTEGFVCTPNFACIPPTGSTLKINRPFRCHHLLQGSFCPMCVQIDPSLETDYISKFFANKTGYPSKRESFLMDTFQLQPVHLSARTLLQPKPTTRRRPTSANALTVGVLNLHWYHQWGDHETAHVI